MPLRLYDTAARALRDFEPLEPGRVGIYICGLTTQGAPHIGHVRFAVAFDVLRRWLETGHGYDVTVVRNVTDIDDKILRKSAEVGEPWYALSYRNERLTAAALDALGVLPVTYEPRATGHIPEMVALMDDLIERGHAYPSPDDSGDVYFDVMSWPQYGSLSHQSPDDMAPAGGRRPARQEGRPRLRAVEGPQGGRAAERLLGHPLRCRPTGLAPRTLGHGPALPGRHLRHPRRRDRPALPPPRERAGPVPRGRARVRAVLLHNAWVTVKGQKMGKSLGNALEVSRVVEVATPLAVRYYLTAAHYRSTIEYHEGSLIEARATVERIAGFLERVDRMRSLEGVNGVLPQPFRDAMDDDINVSGALAVVHDTVRAGNTALDDGDDDAAHEAAAAVVAMTEVLGVNPLSPIWDNAGPGGADDALAALDALVDDQLAARQSARAARDFEAADAIRDRLTEAGIVIDDTPSGARWSLARRNGG